MRRVRQEVLLLATAGMFLLQACGSTPSSSTPTLKGHPKPYRVDGTWYKPMPDAKGYAERRRGLLVWPKVPRTQDLQR